MIDTKALFAATWAAELAGRKSQSPSYEVGDYKVTGRAPAPYGKKNQAWWEDNVHTLVDNWVKWRLEHRDWEIWETPDGKPAIEWEFNITLPGDILVKGLVDRVFVTPVGELVVLDLKTGARMPETAEQLGLYATALEVTYGPQYRASWGYWWDATKGAHSQPFDLSRFTVGYFAQAYAEAIAGINAGCFPAKPANNCRDWCGVARFCHAVGGSEARGTDPLAVD